MSGWYAIIHRLGSIEVRPWCCHGCDAAGRILPGHFACGGRALNAGERVLESLYCEVEHAEEIAEADRRRLGI